MRDEEFQLLLQAVKDCVDHSRGLRTDLRTTILHRPPEPMDAEAVRALRERIGASQHEFATAVNVSRKAVEAWEAGDTRPAGSSLKLLRLGEAYPEIVFAGMVRNSPDSPPPGI